MLARDAWIVGCGNMAGAMVEGWRKAGVDLSRAVAVRPSGKPVAGITTVTAIPQGPAPALVLLGFKPQKLDDIAAGLAPRIGAETTIVSILAGVEVESLRARFPAAAAVVRAMPNLPVSERRGVIALHGDKSDRVTELMAALGEALWTRSEAEFATIGSVAGAGPAYVARFVAALAAAGEGRGLAPDLAQRIALHTVLGTALMAEASGEAMDSLVARVRSPGGTTQAGLEVLDGELADLVARTIAAAARRGEALAAAARAIASDAPLP
jgi:pyrroline-5-carboxylate reductase